MVKLVRLDERLIHGQVATKWSRVLGVDRIIVADDAAAADDMVQKSLMMAAPPTCRVAIVPVNRAIDLCNDGRASALKILLIVSNPDSLLSVVEKVRGIERVNIGNYGRVVPKRADKARTSYSKNLYAYEDEVEVLRKVASLAPCFVQTIPDDVPQDLAMILA